MATNRRVLAVSAVTVLMAGGLAFSCSKSDSKEADDSPPALTTAGTVGVETNALSTTYPDGLAVATFPTDAASEKDVQLATASVGTLGISYEGGGLALHDALSLEEPGSASAPRHAERSEFSLICTHKGTGPNGCPSSFQDLLKATGCAQSQYDENRAKILQRTAANGADQSAKTKSGEGRDALKGGACITPTLTASLGKLARIKTETLNADGYGNCYMPDFGIVEKTFPAAAGKTPEVCMVGATRFELDEIAALVDMALGLDQAMLCQAKKDKLADTELGDGETRVLTESLGRALEDPNVKARVSVKSAKIGRGTASGKTTFSTELVVNVAFRTGGTSELTFKLNHTPEDAKNEAYRGNLSIAYPDTGRAAGPNGQTSTNVTSALTLAYTRQPATVGTSTTPRVTYDLRSGSFLKTNVKYGTDGLLEFNTGNCGNETDAQAPMRYVTYDGYPELDVGKLASWTNFGNSYDEAARGFVFDVKRVGGKAKGCAIAGSAGYQLPGDFGGTAKNLGSFSIRKALAEGYALAPISYWQPMLCREDTPTGGGQGNPSTGRYGEKVWRQCFVKADDGNWIVDDDATEDDATGWDFLEVAKIDPDLLSLPRDPNFDPSKPRVGAGSSGKNGCNAGPKGPAMPQGPVVGPMGPAPAPMPPAGGTAFKQACTVCNNANCSDRPMDACANGTIHMNTCCLAPGQTSCPGATQTVFKCPG